jgi:hypothetical protein
MGIQNSLIGSVAAVALLFAGAAFAAEERDDATHDGVVVSASAESLVMTAKDGKEHSHTLSNSVPLTLDGKACLWSDLKRGQRVRVSTKGDDLKAATRVEALDKQPLFANTHDGAVVTAGTESLVMSSKDGKEHKMSIASDAVVTCDGKTCKAGDLKAGMRIRVTTRASAQTTAICIEALDKQTAFGLKI